MEKQSQSVANMRVSVHAIRESLYRMVTDKVAFLEESPVLNRALDVFDSIRELFDKVHHALLTYLSNILT